MEANGDQPISERCLQQFDRILRWTARKKLWAIITARGSLAAGESVDGKHSDNLFGNGRLRSLFLAMWRQVAKRYKNFELIAGYDRPHPIPPTPALPTRWVAECLDVHAPTPPRISLELLPIWPKTQDIIGSRRANTRGQPQIRDPLRDSAARARPLARARLLRGGMCRGLR